MLQISGDMTPENTQITIWRPSIVQYPPAVGGRKKNTTLNPARAAIESMYVDFFPRFFERGTARTTPTMFAISPIERKIPADTRNAHCGASSTDFWR